MKIPRHHGRLLGGALGIFLGVAAVSSPVLGLSFVFERSLDQVHGQMLALSAEESHLQRTFLVADHLIHELAMAAADGGPDDSAIVDWRSRTENLLKTGREGLAVRASVNHRAIRGALVELEGVLAQPASAEHAGELFVRLIETLGRLRTQTEDALNRLREARVQLVREEERRANLVALASVCAGFIGVMVVCLLTGRFFLRLSRDVGRLKDRAKRIADGDYRQPLGFERKDEVGELAEAIDSMARQLAERETDSARRCLCQAEKMSALGTFATGIAHEIGNPIQSIVVLCEMLGESLAGDPSGRNAEEGRKSLEMIVEQVDRMDSALRDLRDFAGPVPVEMEAVSVNSALGSAIQLLRFDPRFRRIRLTTELGADVPMVYGAGNQLTQVALNALINAADAIDGRDGAIVVTSAPDRGGVLITIEDNGCGMSRETCERALDAFFTTKPPGMGVGLGLSVCKEIVDKHGGTIVLDSEPGRGTRVRIRIPSMQQGGTP